MKLTDLKPYELKELFSGLLDGMTTEQAARLYNVDENELIQYIEGRFLEPYRAANVEVMSEAKARAEQVQHRRKMFGWMRTAAVVAAVCFGFIVIAQLVLGGFEQANVISTFAYITDPAERLLKLSLGTGFLIFTIYNLFPILSVFINERINTVTLSSTFLKATPDGQLRFLAGVLLALCIFVGSIMSAKAQTQTPAACILQTAKKEVGTFETGGNNRGPRIDFYRSVSLNKTCKNYSDAWCGYFVDYCYKTCNVKTPVKFPPRAADWFTDKSKIVYRRNFKYGVIKPEPRPGDVIGYLFSSGRISHVEILERWGDTHFYAYGGNTSNKDLVQRDANETDGVRHKKRKIQTAYIVARYL